jgi:hypothetical protein
MFAVSVASQLRCCLGFESTSGVIAIRSAMAMNPQLAFRRNPDAVREFISSAFLSGNLFT